MLTDEEIEELMKTLQQEEIRNDAFVERFVRELIDLNRKKLLLNKMKREKKENVELYG
jgi:uncharacterized protein YeaO (DUF488 family)